MPLALPPLALYIHIPWCTRKCPYCDFNSHRADKSLPETEYISALLSDLAHHSPAVKDRRIVSIFFGGGTPSLMSGSGIDKILRGVERCLELDDAVEITLEANPGSAEQRRFADYRSAGVNRLSIGIQSFDATQLRKLQRVHGDEEARAAVGKARAAGFTNINLDLMYALPGQQPRHSNADLSTAIALQPEHISWYQLTLEPNTVFWSKPPAQLPDMDRIADIESAGQQQLAAAGYHQYEVSAYSLAGRKCLHNLNYWQFGDYLGIGAGAHSKLTTEDGCVMRSCRRRSPQDYLAGGDDSPGQLVAKQWRLTKQDLILEFMMNALRLTDQPTPPSKLFVERTGISTQRLEPVLDELRMRGLWGDDRERLDITAMGQRFLNEVLTCFQRHCSSSC